MPRKRTLIGIAALLGVAIAVPATTAFARSDDPPKQPAPAYPPTVVPDPVTASAVAGEKQGHKPPAIVVRTSGPAGWAPPPLPIPPRPRGKTPPPAKSHSAERPDDQSPPPPPTVDLEPEDAGPN